MLAVVEMPNCLESMWINRHVFLTSQDACCCAKLMLIIVQEENYFPVSMPKRYCLGLCADFD